MDNLKQIVWEVRAGNTHKFVLADSIETVKQYFYIGGGGFISQRADMQATAEMESLTPKPLLLKYFFVSFKAMRGLTNSGDVYWAPGQAVVNRHPFEFIKDQNRNSLIDGLDAILVSYQQITEDEYHLYEKVYNHQ